MVVPMKISANSTIPIHNLCVWIMYVASNDKRAMIHGFELSSFMIVLND